MITKDRNGFISITLKLANMRNEQDFTIYPYSGGDLITIQSSKRIARLNIKDGKSSINKKNEQGGAYFVHLQMDCIEFVLNQSIIQVFQKYFWENQGQQGGGNVIKWDNKELFSK